MRKGEGRRKELVAEYGRSELCGIVETLTGATRSTTLLAVRDTEIAKIPAGLINSIKLKYPMVVSRLINLLGKRLLSLQQPGQVAAATWSCPCSSLGISIQQPGQVPAEAI